MSNSTAEEVQSEAINSPPNHNHSHNHDHEQVDADADGTEIMAKGIYSMISSVIRDFDASAVSTSQSQLHLFSALDRLTSELDRLLEDAPLPFIMHHAAKLSNVTKRVSSLNSLLRSIQRRLDNIDRMLSLAVPNDQTNIGASQ